MTPDEIAAETIKALKQALDAAHGTADDVYGKYLAEREAREKADAALCAISSVIGRRVGCEFMDPPDGGDVSLAEQVSRLIDAREKAEAALREIEPMLPGIAHLRERAEKADAEVATWIERHDLKRDELFKAEAEVTRLLITLTAWDAKLMKREVRNTALREAADLCDQFRHPDGSSSGLAASLADAILALIKEPSHD